MQTIEYYRSEFNSHLDKTIRSKSPHHLYDPMVYLLGLGGKRLRPSLTLLSAELFGKDFREALNAALAVELFHNFSLIHDDIMDSAPLRRGKETVHQKWDVNTGILSGDAMLISAYQFLESYSGNVFKALVQLFTRTALRVCEGQQLDMDFETRDDVTVAEYLKMIEFKTAVLVAAAMKMGAIVAEVSSKEKELLYNFGINLGIAFQLQDDYLDAFGNPETFGKQMGGDIMDNKKTFLFLKTKDLCSQEELKELNHLYAIQPNDPTAKISIVKRLFENSGAAEQSKIEIERYTRLAFKYLDQLDVSEKQKGVLRVFGKELIGREQ